MNPEDKEAQFVAETLKRTLRAEQEVESLARALEELRSRGPRSAGSAEAGVGPDDRGLELETLKADNVKLRYRLGILKRAAEAASAGSGGAADGLYKSRKAKLAEAAAAADKDGEMYDETKYSRSLLETLTSMFRSALCAAFPELAASGGEAVPCPVTVSQKFGGDYQFNGAMAISGLLKGRGVKVAPRDVALKIVDEVETGEVIEKLEVAGPGFVNIYLARALVEREVGLLFRHGVRPPRFSSAATTTMTFRQKVVVDFSSPNIAKEMHVGHLRSTIIGESVSRLFEFLGHDVVRLNHVGDWGTQFGMLIAHLQDEFPDYLAESPPISDLMAFYKRSKQRFDEDPDFKKRAYACVVKLQSREPDSLKAWSLICDVSRQEFDKIYDRLGISIIERGESFYQDKMNEVVKELEDRNVLEDDNGRKLMFADGADIPLTIVKSDGGFTYDTSDMAALQHRITVEKADRIVYVTDAGQWTHFQSVIACARKLGWLGRNPDKKAGGGGEGRVRVDHVGFGVVLGEDKKKFKTRSGDTVRLVDLLDEGVKRARAKLEEKGTSHFVGGEDEVARTATALAYSCIKFADLSHNRNQEYVFSFDRMLADKGFTAVYLMYAFTRIRSIGRTANLSAEDLRPEYEGGGGRAGPSLEHERELRLAKLLLRFPDIISRLSEDLLLHTVAEFLFDIANTFSEFYDVCYCVEKDRATGQVVKVNKDRIVLCEATAAVMAQCFDLLGLQTVERM